MVTIKTTLRTISGPTSFKELTVEKFQEVVKTTDPVKHIAILYDLNYDELMQEESKALLAPLEKASAFLKYESLNYELPASGKIKIGNKEYNIPGASSNGGKHKLGAYTLGQAIQCRSHLEKCKTYGEGIAKAIAIYMQPTMTGLPFTMELVDEVEKIILRSPVTEVLGTGFFLLQSVEELWKSVNEHLESIEIPGDDNNAEIARAANVDRLTPFADLSIIDQFAQTYHLDPDLVYLKSFNTVTKLMILWKERERFRKTYNMLKKLLEEKIK